MLESKWGLSRVIYCMQFYFVIAVCTICMECSLLCKRNVLLTRNGRIEGSLFCLRNISRETAVKKIFYSPGMVASRDSLYQNSHKRHLQSTTVLNVNNYCEYDCWKKERKLRKQRINVWFSSPHHLLQRFMLLHLFLQNNLDIN